MYKGSLLLRVGLAMALLVLLAVVGMLSSVFITENSKGFAAAINQAGTLRMQSYRIASSLVHDGVLAEGTERTRQLVAEFEGRLDSPRIQDLLSRGVSPSVREAYAVVERNWKQRIAPRLKVYLAVTSGEQDKQFFLRNVDAFVDDIHTFVKALEVEAEAKNYLLRIIQIVSLVLTLLVGAVSILLTKRTVLKPLNELLTCANAARHGDFSVRSRHLSEDELGQLGGAFNMMAEDLSKTYAELEARVRAKTADLERSKQSLELLYNASKRLNSAELSVEVLEALIRDIEQVIDIRAGSVCLGSPGDDRAFRLASTRIADKDSGLHPPMDCSHCFGDGGTHCFSRSLPDGAEAQLFSIPIRDQAHFHGVLVVEMARGSGGLAEWQQRLLETVASHIAVAINISERESQNRMVSLLEERSVIARELHDSLAQSLSYLKIQVARLEKAIIEDAGKDMVLGINTGVRKGLNGAYRQLRELLSTFRLRISEEGLHVALRETVKEYRDRSGIDIALEDHMANCKFSPNAEVHVMHIIREALSNVTRHANADSARVYLDCNMDGMVTVMIEDNGIGLAEERDMMMHYGLPIMKERAEWLGGKLDIGESAEGGTCVKLVFTISDTEQNKTSERLVERMKHE